MNFWVLFSAPCTARADVRIRNAIAAKSDSKKQFFSTRAGAQNCAPQRLLRASRGTITSLRKKKVKILTSHFLNPPLGVRCSRHAPSPSPVQELQMCQSWAQSAPITLFYDRDKFSIVFINKNAFKIGQLSRARSRLYQRVFQFFLRVLLALELYSALPTTNFTNSSIQPKNF